MRTARLPRSQISEDFDLARAVVLTAPMRHFGDNASLDDLPPFCVAQRIPYFGLHFRDVPGKGFGLRARDGHNSLLSKSFSEAIARVGRKLNERGLQIIHLAKNCCVLAAERQ